jgi:hypothetical protein
MSRDLRILGPKLRKLLPLLASDKSGEVVATARAIGRTLEGAGADFHDLARLLARDSSHTSRPPRPRYEPPCDSPQTPTEVARWCLNSGGRLTAKERDFLDSMLRWRRELTPRQLQYLEDVFVRCGGHPW